MNSIAGDEAVSIDGDGLRGEPRPEPLGRGGSVCLSANMRGDAGPGDPTGEASYAGGGVELAVTFSPDAPPPPPASIAACRSDA